MKSFVDSIVEYLEVKLQRWKPLFNGLITGVGSVLALAFIVCIVFGIYRVNSFMPFIIGYCSANSGFKVWGKSDTEDRHKRRLQCGIVGIATGLFGYLVQYQINWHFFGVLAPFTMLLFFLAIGLFMGLIGGWLKSATERSRDFQR